METIQFLVQGSAPEPYEVTFVRSESGLSASCSCPAGFSGTYCKHRISIFGGSKTGIVSPNGGQVAIVTTWLPGSAIASCIAEVARAELELVRAKKQVADLKKELAAAMGGKR